MSLEVLGLILNLVGGFILTLVTIFECPYLRIFGENKWWKRYWWTGWKPIFKIRPPSGKAYWRIKWSHKAGRYGIIPPKYSWNIIGFLFILDGCLLQLKAYLS